MKAAATHSFRLSSRSSAETQSLGRAIGARLEAGMTTTLSGPLGSGKTTLVQGIACGAGCDGYVRSPSFVLINEYQGRIPLAHCDLYRIADAREAIDLGLDEYLDHGALLVEWSERYRPLASHPGLRIEIRFGAGDEERDITVNAQGARAAALVATLGIAMDGGQPG